MEVCIIPIRIFSNASQSITISNIDVRYRKNNVVHVENSIYSLLEDSPRVSSNYKKLNFNMASFRTPESEGNYTFTLKLNNQNIFSEKIEVKNVSIIKSVSPLKTASSVPTDFIAYVESPENVFVSGYFWDFGNGATKTTSTNKTTNTYQQLGKYTLSITLMDNRGISSSQNFEIEVESPKEIINTTLTKNTKNIEEIKIYIQNKSAFQQRSINSVLKIDNISSKIEIIKQRYELSLQETNLTKQTEEMNQIVSELMRIRVPDRIFVTKQANSFIFIPKKENIELGTLKIIAGGDYNSEKTENYKNAVVAWNIENLNISIDFNEFSAEYESGTEKIAVVFELKINEKKNIQYDYYLTIYFV